MLELGLQTTDRPGIETGEVSLDLATALGPDVGRVIIDGRAVLLDPATGDSHLLDPTATLVLQCLDGTSRLGEIAADIAAELGADRQEVDAGVLTVARELGAAGLLDGVRRARPVAPERSAPVGVPIGSDLSAWSDWPAPTIGSDLTLAIHWGTQCGFCTMIGPELADLSGSLAAVGAEMLLMTTGDADALAAQLGDVVLPALHLSAPPDFFAAVGTPSMYVVDRARLTVEPLAVGAFDVPALARRIAGLDEAPAEGAS